MSECRCYPPGQEIKACWSEKEVLPGKVNASILDVGFPAFVVQPRAFKCLVWDENNVFLVRNVCLEMWLDSVFPFTFHDGSYAGLAEFIPFAT